MAVVNLSLDDLDDRLSLLQQSVEHTKKASALRISDTTDAFDVQEEELLSKLKSLRKTRAKALSRIKSETRDQLRVLAQEAQQLKVQRNALVPINRLPAEIISHSIFAALKDTWCIGNRAWIKATHVCQLWRQVALGAASLWTDIGRSKFTEDWLCATLDRSKSSPLRVSIGHEWSCDALLRVLRDMERFKSLQVSLMKPAQIEDALRSVTNSALLLEELCLGYSQSSLLHLSFFEGKASLLRRLTLRRCRALSPSILLRQITHLCIHFSKDEYTRAQLTDLLASMPDLQVLDLFCSLAQETVICKPIFWKSLKSLVLREEPPDCASLLSVIRLPPSCHADVRPQMEYSKTFADADLCDIPAMIATNHDAYTFLNASSAHGSPLDFMTIAAGVHAVNSGPWSPKDYRLALVIPKKTYARPGDNKICAPTRAMVVSMKQLNLYALSHLTMNLAIEQVDFMTLCDWLDIFSPMQQLHELRLSAPNLERMLGALYEGTRGAEATDVQIRLPRLRRLHLALAAADHADHDVSCSDAIIAVLSDCLVARQNAYPAVSQLEHLVLGHGLLGEDRSLQLLKVMVPDVATTFQRRFV